MYLPHLLVLSTRLRKINETNEKKRKLKDVNSFTGARFVYFQIDCYIFLDRLLINFVLHVLFYLEAKKQRKKKSLPGE